MRDKRVPQTSIRLFNAWAAQHKRVIALEDQLAAAQQEGGATEELAGQVAAARAEAERMLEEARAQFRNELKERGLV